MVAREREIGRTEIVQPSLRRSEVGGAIRPAVGEVARRDDEVGVESGDDRADAFDTSRESRVLFFACGLEVHVGDVDDSDDLFRSGGLLGHLLLRSGKRRACTLSLTGMSCSVLLGIIITQSGCIINTRAEAGEVVATGRREAEGDKVRRSNIARCAVALRDDGPATAAELARRTGLSRPTAETVVAALMERGLVTESSDLTPGGRGTGRPARIYRFHSAKGYFAGVDVGQHAIKVVVGDLAGRVVGAVEEPTDESFVGAGRMDAVKRVIGHALATAGVSGHELAAMGVAVPGLVGDGGQLIVSHIFPDWEGVDIAGHLSAQYDCAVRVENDTRLASLAEHRLGAARLADDVICLFAGHRLSMGLILGGQVRRGHHGAAGEVGDIVFSGHVDRTGQLRWTTASSAEEVFRQAAAGQQDSQQEVERFVSGLSRGVATVAMAIDPDLIVIGGGLSRAEEALLEPLRTAVNAEITVPVRPKIVGSELGAESVVLGALARAYGEFSEIFFGVDGVREPAIDIAAVRSHGSGKGA
nr:ROK family transcriptional regulator [Microbacterium sp. 69-10]